MNIKKSLKIVVLFLLSWFVLHIFFIVIDGLKNSNNKADVAVILGNKVNTDGTLSDRLTQRLNCGLDLYRSGRVKNIIVSGGLGKEGFYEGDKMKDYLVKNGVPNSIITVDNYGDNTLKTVKNTLALRSKLHFNSMIVVSQYYHLTRTKMLFRKHGFDDLSSASPLYFEWRDIYSIIREFAAYYKELF
ncbi:YdcF family protein [Pedobacter punctiformis]|uniref:YdcF family protein n=1 Tax=Pedobacter punctiformis TaxID=3004097 RepID=A0ABT4L981_9SPHI|nr:YdcF family protein [Pedobacter sp. HCMS5-2]MCZ4244479.1 YdcF family protein [Pedobacter sp. HCMS5-2]